MDLLTTGLAAVEAKLSLSAQPSPSAGISNNEHLTVSAPSTPTSDQSSSNLLANLTAAGSSDEKEERPSLSYKDLIIEAIESSPEKRLKLSEIYQVSLFSTALHNFPFPKILYRLCSFIIDLFHNKHIVAEPDIGN